MFVNLSEFFDLKGKHSEILVHLDTDSFSNGYVDYTVVEKGDLKLGIDYLGDDKLSVTGEVDVLLKMSCDRCLQDVNVDVPVSFEYTVVKPDGYHEIDDDEQYFMDGYQMDVQTLVNNEVIMSLPMKVLCKDDCKGLCPVCGTNRNNGDCGCDTFVPDPRMAAITDIFNAKREV